MKRPWLACADCELPYSDDGWADFVVSDAVWSRITAEDGATILCATCMTRRAVRAGIETAAGKFTSGPFTTIVVTEMRDADSMSSDAAVITKGVGQFHSPAPYATSSDAGG